MMITGGDMFIYQVSSFYSLQPCSDVMDLTFRLLMREFKLDTPGLGGLGVMLRHASFAEGQHIRASIVHIVQFSSIYKLDRMNLLQVIYHNKQKI
jgi:hypothetical protein